MPNPDLARLFFSYSHSDEAHRDRLEKALAMLKRQRLLETWHDRRIVAGQSLDHVISSELEVADVILLLISPDFLASDYCYDVEMIRAMERHVTGAAVVIPVILRPSDWHDTPFGQLKALPRDGKPVTKWTDIDEAFLDISQGIKQALMARRSSAPPVSLRSLHVPRVADVRSSNLRVARTFTEKEKDDFLHEAFEYIARFFENSLEELARRNSDIEGRFRRIDSNRFTAVAYRNGEAIARCTVWFGGQRSFAGGIAYSADDSGSTGGFNETLTVEEEEDSLHLKTAGLSAIFRGGDVAKLTVAGGAEAFWALFIEPLQQRRQ